MKTLVLNASWEPLCVVPLQRAVVMVLRERAVIVEAKDEAFHSQDVEVPIPTVVRLTHYVRIPYRRRVPVSRRTVLQRDNYVCGYCSGKADTIDHIRPKAQGGGHHWMNVVAACRACNGRKDNRTPAQANMPLRIKPFEPEGSEALVVIVGRLEASWGPYLPAVA